MNELTIAVLIIYILALVVITIAIYNEANNRKGASSGMAFVFTFFLTPIAGLLYLLLFPRKELSQEETLEEEKFIKEEDVKYEIIPNRYGKFDINEIVIENNTKRKFRILDAYKDKTYYCCDANTDEIVGIIQEENLTK